MASDILDADWSSMWRTEFWARMSDALGATYARSWAADHVLATLGGRSVDEALASGMDAKVVWRAVHGELDLPDVKR